MTYESIVSGEFVFPLIKCASAVVGSGAAAYNAAHTLLSSGNDVCLFTEGVNMGTSRNTGSDKQTYYKLGRGGDSLDSNIQLVFNNARLAAKTAAEMCK